MGRFECYCCGDCKTVDLLHNLQACSLRFVKGKGIIALQCYDPNAPKSRYARPLLYRAAPAPSNEISYNIIASLLCVKDRKFQNNTTCSPKQMKVSCCPGRVAFGQRLETASSMENVYREGNNRIKSMVCVRKKVQRYGKSCIRPLELLIIVF